MTHTAACHTRSPAYRHKRNTPAPISSAAEIDTVKAITSFQRSLRTPHRAGYPLPKLRRVFRRSQRARNRHLSHAPDPSPDSAPHSHLRSLRHPFNICPMLITSRHGSLAFRKVRSTKKRGVPDTIGSGKHTAFPFGQPRLIPVGDGAARLYSVFFSSPYGPGPCRIQSRTGRGLVGNRCRIGTSMMQ
jgi:hypothetical protein